MKILDLFYIIKQRSRCDKLNLYRLQLEFNAALTSEIISDRIVGLEN